MTASTTSTSPPSSSPRGRALRVFGAFLCFWLAPAGWLALTPPFNLPHRAQILTRQRLATLNVALHAYVTQWKTAPPDLATLRAFAAAESFAFNAYDPYGERFNYLRLDERHYLLRSFGEDGEQNTLSTARDTGVIDWGPRVSKSLTYQYVKPDKPHLYPAALLIGADAPDAQWTAKLYVDPERQTRQLLVRHRTKNGLFMVARHDAVEEFLWLPDSRRIVFTASGSERHRDGLFVWDLMTDALTNLTELAGEARIEGPSGKGPMFWLSLAGIAPLDGGVVVYSFVAPRNNGELDPGTFFSSKQLRATIVGDVAGDFRPDEPPTLAAPLVAGRLDLTAHLLGKGGLKVQRAWLTLPLAGNMEDVLLDWHTYSERETQGPLFPYTLWLLSSLYSESFAMMAPKDVRDADVLRTFGTEIARALLNYPLAPTYIKALAMNTYNRLLDGQPLPYHMTQLEAVGVAKAELPQN